MATSKSWTAYDIQQERLIVVQNGTSLHIERPYVFVDDEGVALERVANGRLRIEVEWSIIPSNIQIALQTINEWTYNQILAQEGME